MKCCPAREKQHGWMDTGWFQVCWLFPSWSPGWQLWPPLPSNTEGDVSHVSRSGKDPNSKFKVQFLLKVYRFCIPVKLKNGKWSQDMLGTVCEGLPAALERLGEEQQRGMSWTRGTGLLTSGGAPSSGRKNTPSQGRGKTAPSFYERAEARLLGS